MKQKVHSLIDKVYGRQNLTLAWKQVQRNGGCGGIDGITIRQFEERQDFYLDLLHGKLRDGTYRPKPVKRVEIPKSDVGTRKLGIPAILDRICQQALVQRMAPIFDLQFLDCNYGYRQGRSPHDAMRQVWQELQAGKVWVVDADLRQLFDTIDQHKLIDLIAEAISDGCVLKLIKDILGAGAIEGGIWKPTLTGVPQGGPASPLWSNIFLTPFDRAMTAAGFSLVRWADDFVMLCQSQAEAEQALRVAARFLQDCLGVSLHPQKTRIVHVRQGFEFLGYKIKGGKGFQLPPSKRRKLSNPQNLYAIPREKSVKRFQEQIRCLTKRTTPLKLRELIEKINPVIRGWGNYYRKAHVRRLFNR